MWEENSLCEMRETENEGAYVCMFVRVCMLVQVACHVSVAKKKKRQFG